jgi:hypothetical protein
MRGSAGMVTRYKNGGMPAIMTSKSKVIQKINADKSHPLLVCIFCKHYLTDIEFDLDLHLYENHKPKLVKLPIGKGSISFRIAYAICEGKRLGEVLKNASKETREKLGWFLS